MLREALVAWLFTVLVEVPIVAVAYRSQWRKMAVTAALATSLTNIAMNVCLPDWTTSSFAFLVIGETAALVVEAAIYFRVQRDAGMGQALLASACANTTSFGLGLVAAPWLFGP